MKLFSPIILAMMLSGCSTLSSLSGNTNVPLATCSDAVAAIDLATAMKAAGKLSLAQEQTIEAAIGQLQPVCNTSTPQTILTAAQSSVLANIIGITGSSN